MCIYSSQSILCFTKLRIHLKFKAYVCLYAKKKGKVIIIMCLKIKRDLRCIQIANYNV